MPKIKIPFIIEKLEELVSIKQYQKSLSDQQPYKDVIGKVYNVREEDNYDILSFFDSI